MSDSVYRYYDYDGNDDVNCAKVICEPYDYVQRDCISTWQTKCLSRDFPEDKVKELGRALWYHDIVFPITIKDIKLFKEMMSLTSPHS